MNNNSKSPARHGQAGNRSKRAPKQSQPRSKSRPKVKMPATHFAMDVMNQSQNSDDKLEALTSQLFISSLAHTSLLQPPFTLNLKHILNSHNNLFLSTVHTHLSAT